ncbi:MAG TPA: beta-ribofuranosylaminobenzene 5'-phosphate synthase family protein [Planctomycetaceae bacterium]|nr:beta-ribofuranosylaminobenzene 5'-phosphate synthase family protein [Planctomycetaceae bacterium]
MAVMHDRIVITTGARLHFGFFAHRPPATVTATASSIAGALEQANYGGIGLMIDSPSFVVAASKSDCDRSEWLLPETSGEGRVDRIVAHYRRTCPPQRLPVPCAIEVRQAIPSHSGLGSGTQLAMAVAQALALLARDRQVDAVTLAHWAGRGKRSAIGIHGFACGGFLVDGGKRSEDEIGRLVARAEFPDGWRWLLVAPADKSGTGLSGQDEIQALEQLPRIPLSLTERLCHLVLLEMLPAIAACDCDWFGEALYEFGRSVGDYFRPVQGGRYADSRMATLVEWLRGEGVRGVAQTSWGPTIAACCQDALRANALKDRILADDRWQGCQAQIVRPLNTGAAIQL